MLHELLLALSGDTGGIFVQKLEEGLKVAADIPFIHDCEVTLLNRICRLGSYYCCFQEFIKKHSSLVVESCDVYNSCGLYIQAFSTGLDQVLHDYRQVLVELEGKVLKDPCLPLSHVEHSLEKYQVLFPALDNLINQIQTQKAGGCKLLDILYQNSICGIPVVKECMERILFICHGVLYQQLSAWLLHGLLTDRNNEFLITRVTSQNIDSSKNVPEGVTVNDLGIPGVTGKQLSEIMEGEDKQSIPVLWQFKINADMLPSYIPTRVAEKILFVGDSVKMFEEAKQGIGSTATNSIVHEKEEEFLRSLYSLQQRPKFSLTVFESEMDKIRTYVAEHLWKLVVEDAQLLRHLQILKDFFLLGRGELFSALIEKAQQLLKVPPSGNTSHDANAFFQQVLHKFLYDDEESGALFTLNVDMNMYQSKKKSMPDQVVVSGWDCLKLEYNVKWPLHILFQEPILDKYNVMFRHLLNVKRTQQDLQGAWAKHMASKNQTNVSSLTRVWLLRMHMAFLVDNLQYYLQVDVLEAQYTQLIDKINNTRDFESIRLAHDNFITTLMAQSFLLMKPVAHCLEEILSLCQAYCTLLLQITDVISERIETQLYDISKNYERQSNLLFKILSSVRSHQASPHLAQLLLRIDFNKQFSCASSPSSWKAEEPSSSEQVF
ncbi:gamma-tubulin complex component 4-like [Actinia tenebrosa]|uniref:Gamma-tubulin complex component n=1 Tax=Actinia tenebrosa TaxID=6105 RepID=A0A6P8HZT8_ACTTE|nr:gamma-tubulin complex component 4-like [Actinia tenebrosa]